MGTLVLASGTSGRLTIIDGQQRLATTAILIAVFRNYFRRVGDVNRSETMQSDYLASRSLRSGELEPRLVLNENDAPFFMEQVIRGEGTTPMFASSQSNERIRFALEFLTERVNKELTSAGRNWADAIYNWIEFLEERVRVIVVTVSNEADAFLIFETLNDRGTDLTISDLLKNYLFGLAGESELPIVRAAWINIISAFEGPGEEQTLTTFLRHYWSSTHGATRERDLYRRIRSEVRSAQQVVQVVGTLERAAPDYAALLDAEHERWASFQSIRRSEVESLLRFGLEQIRPLLLAAIGSFSEAELRRLIRSAVAWAVRGLVAGGIGGGTTERYYSDGATLIATGRSTTVGDVFDSLAPILPTDEVFEAAFATRRVLNSRLAKYYLLAIERFKQGLAADAAFPSNEEESSVALERVVPRRASPSVWPAFDPSELGQAALRLGNDVLLARDEADRFAGTDWAQRSLLLATARYATSRAVAQVTDWNQAAIDTRQTEFAALATTVWPRQPQ